MPRGAPGERERHRPPAELQLAAERRRRMLRRRTEVAKTAIYAISVAACFLLTWNYFNFHGLWEIISTGGIYPGLIIAIYLAEDVPFFSPRPRLAATCALAAWGIALVHLAFISKGSDGVSTVAVFALVGLAMPLIGFPPTPFARSRLWIGCSITVLGLTIGSTALSTDPPTLPTSGIGLTLGDASLYEPHGGIVVQLSVFPDGCSKVNALLNIYGTSEFWAHHTLQKGRIPFQVILPEGSARDVQVVPLTDATNATLLTQPLNFAAPPFPLYKRNRVTVHISPPLNLRAGLTSVYDYGDYELVDGWIGANWPKVRAPVLVAFEPHWLTGDAIGSCFLQTPPLVGASAWPSVEAAVWDGVEHRHLLLPADAIVKLFNVEYVRGEPRPAPTAVEQDSFVWTCEDDSAGTKTIGVDRSVPSYPLKDYRRSARPDCGELTTLQEGDAETFQALLLLLVGGLISIGLAVALERAPPTQAK
jgi:hypothetical protein